MHKHRINPFLACTFYILHKYSFGRRVTDLLTWTSFCFSELTCRFEGLPFIMFPVVSDRVPLDFDLMAFVANGP